ncbi:5'-3' exonuclease [Tenggerimyces flavus]|uniref:5'-3' exonuclease n=1 Tax=Tenggerimyces flavus TaxID=1708749 RepID=A0ABV7Y970_9ACTN|nr:5'-3' exonuclease [Tenggerimyces flavus]MBM7788234.1 5'-3' exonuclease [Tenggerimyces flavus]
MADQQRLMLLDAASLYFRAFFGVPESMKSPDGKPVNAIRGLLDFIARLVTAHEPTHVVACWDDDWRPAWRVALVPSYKSHRVVRTVKGGRDIQEQPSALTAQEPVIREVLDALGIAVLGGEELEADDVIGTLSQRAKMPVDVVTGDRDLFQLVDDEREVRILYIARGVGRLEIVDEGVVEKKYGIPGRLYADFATLRGDNSDGLPGVAGVGDKTAASLVTTYGDLDGIVAAANDDTTGMSPTLKSKIKAGELYLTAAREVVLVARNADLPEVDAKLPKAPKDTAKWKELTERWGLSSSAERVNDALFKG